MRTGSGLQRLTSSGGIDTEARYSPDGQSIYFVSDRSGGFQIYRMNASGGEVKRLTFKGGVNISPLHFSRREYLCIHLSRRDGGDPGVYALDLVNGQGIAFVGYRARDEFRVCTEWPLRFIRDAAWP